MLEEKLNIVVSGRKSGDSTFLELLPKIIRDVTTCEKELHVAIHQAVKKIFYLSERSPCIFIECVDEDKNGVEFRGECRKDTVEHLHVRSDAVVKKLDIELFEKRMRSLVETRIQLFEERRCNVDRFLRSRKRIIIIIVYHGNRFTSGYVAF